MKYSEIKPSTHLQHIVRLFWIYEEGEEVDASRISTYRIIADGCPGLIVQYSGNGAVYCDQIGTPVPQSFLYGQSTEPINNYSSGPTQTFGVYFQPWAVPVIFGFGADELTNSQVDLSLIHASLRDQLIETESFAQRIRIVSEFIYRKINNNLHQNDSVQLVANKIARTGGTKNLRDLYSDYYLSERTLVRAFKKQVGITPKHFSKIMRFQTALNLVRQKDVSSFAEMAVTCEYADQSHFIRDFKEFSGFTPSQYHLQCRERIRNYPQLT